jgi:TolB-like protein/Tfp pilus assembly protein PilF
MSETRKLAAILVADIVGYSRLAGADEDRTLARLRGLRSDLIDPVIAAHHGRVVKRMGDGIIVEFRSAVDAVRCAIEIQTSMIERNAGVAEDRRIELRVGIHVGDVVEESDGDIMGDGVNIAARLEGVCEPNEVYLSGAAYEQVRDRLEERFVDLGAKELKNIARPVRVYALKMGVSSRAPAAPAKKSGPPRLSIVVLPFANISDDPEQDHFVDGVTDSLTTDLSRMRNAVVIARSTALAFKDKPIDVRTIGRELNVRYILEGSVQRRGNRMRVNVQLIDAESAAHLWAERFDKPLADFFDMQDEIVARLANELGIELNVLEAGHSEKARNPDSIDHVFQGMGWYLRGPTPENVSKARDFFVRALQLDLNDAQALVMMAIVDVVAVNHSSVDDRVGRLVAAEAAARKALSLAPHRAMAHFCMGLVLGATNRAAEGIAAFDRALALDRNLASAHAHIGWLKIYVGRAEETESHVREALRLSPRDFALPYWWSFVGGAAFCLDRYDEAAAAFHRSIDANRNWPMSHFFLAAALVALGRTEEAKVAASEGLALQPDFSIAHLRAPPVPSSNPYLAARERLFEGLRSAGVPEE